MQANDLQIFLNAWLSNLSFEERTKVLIGVCQTRNRRYNRAISPRNRPSTNTVAINRFIETLNECVRESGDDEREEDLNLDSDDDSIVYPNYPLEPKIIIRTIPKIVITDVDILFRNTEEDLDAEQRKYLDNVTTVLDLTSAEVPSKNVSNPRQGCKKTMKNSKNPFFTCCIIVDDDEDDDEDDDDIIEV